jgi:hypothetical protein
MKTLYSFVAIVALALLRSRARCRRDRSDLLLPDLPGGGEAGLA